MSLTIYLVWILIKLKQRLKVDSFAVSACGGLLVNSPANNIVRALPYSGLKVDDGSINNGRRD